MQIQRTLFFGSRPESSPKKDGENRPVPSRRFSALNLDDLEIHFSNTTVTRFGGYPLWAEFWDRLGLSARFASHVKMNRGHGFTAPELSRFLIDSRILGASRLSDVDAMRHDPLLCKAHGLTTLASDETLGRYLKAYTQGQQSSLDRLNTRTNDRLWKQSHRIRRGPAAEGQIVLDYDSTTMTVYGKQEGADRGRCFRKKDKPGYQPKFAFIGGLGIMLHQELYPQSFNLQKDFRAFHQETVKRLPKDAEIWAIRGDGALYSGKRIRWLEGQSLVYAISAMRTDHLRDRIAEIPQDAWIEGTDRRKKPYSIAKIQYRPASWKKERTYIISRRLKDLRGQEVMWEHERYKYFAYVTNYEGSPFEQYSFAVERCSLENFIKEAKGGFHYDFLPCQEDHANRAYLSHIQMAYNLMIWWKLLKAPPAMNRWTIDTIRQRLLEIPGNLRRYADGWKLLLPDLWPWRSIFKDMAAVGGFVPT